MDRKSFVFVSSLNRGAPYFQGARGKGIAAYAFDPETGGTALAGEVEGIDNPTYLAVHPTNGSLYAISEVFGWNEGTVTAYRFDPNSGKFKYLNKQPTLGSITAYCSLDRTGRFLLVANYSIGPLDDLPGKSVAIFPLRADGGLDPAVASASHEGKGPNEARQERSHAHCIMASPDNRHVIIADLGIDRMVAHGFDAKNGAIELSASSELAPGAGPRHFVFHPDGRHAFSINELDSTINALAYDAASGAFALRDTVSALPEMGSVESHCAGIQISPDGRFVYGANRGHDSIVIYAVDASSGKLSLVGLEPTRGATPRDHVIDPSGRFLLVCNQNADCVVVFRRDAATGKLTDNGRPIAVGTPMCAKFASY